MSRLKGILNIVLGMLSETLYALLVIFGASLVGVCILFVYP
ncbi:MAG: hypothetical protein ACE14U_06350 [Candidatus Velamenicoccus archaeovorus]